MTALTHLSLAAARDGLAAGDFTAVELAEAHLAAIEARADLNAFITVAAERARASAEEVDTTSDPGPLAGIPLGLKDVFDTAGILAHD